MSADTSPDRTDANQTRVGNLAFFFDVDGTLLDLAPVPDAVVVAKEVIDLLRALVMRNCGAVALISGRSITTLDALFQPLLLPAAGLHGFERRDAVGTYRRHSPPPGQVLERARSLLRQVAARDLRLVLEDKSFALALHYRQAPELERSVVTKVEAIAQAVAPALELQRGRMVVELRPAEANKAMAIAAFMREAPFAGRRPVCLGDDLTDECAFEWVNGAAGISIAVGVARHTAARAHLPSVREARMWLRRILRDDEQSLRA
jgi:trehalose 6-phosphate phosphatase